MVHAAFGSSHNYWLRPTDVKVVYHENGSRLSSDFHYRALPRSRHIPRFGPVDGLFLGPHLSRATSLSLSTFSALVRLHSFPGQQCRNLLGAYCEEIRLINLGGRPVCQRHRCFINHISTIAHTFWMLTFLAICASEIAAAADLPPPTFLYRILDTVLWQTALEDTEKLLKTSVYTVGLTFTSRGRS